MTGDLLRVLALWRGRSAWLLLGAAVALAALACSVVLMGASGARLAAALASGGLAAGIALRVFGPARVVLRYLDRLSTHAATFRALADLRVWFFRRVAGSAAGGLGFRRAGDVLSRLVADIEALDSLYLRILVPLAGAMLLLPALVLIAARGDGALAAIVGVMFALAAFALPALAARATGGSGARLASATAGLRVATLDALTGLRDVRAYAAEGRVLAQVQARDGALLTAQDGLARRLSLAGAGVFLCAQLALAAILWRAPLAPGAAVVTAFVAVAAFEAAGGLTRAGALGGHAAAAARRVMEAADAPPAVPEPAASLAAAPPSGHALRVEGVRFAWPGMDAARPVFDGISLDVPAGTRVAILGPSGSGKSTLAALLLKQAAPQAGRILLGGVDLAILPQAAIPRHVGWLAQTTHLFDDTVRSNLALASPDADDAALWDALDRARVADVVRGLPDRLDAWIGEGGARVSGGEGRRIALARTLLSPAPILVLDEPAAGLDAETERQFHATLNDTLAGRTVLLIAHRLTGVERLDRIYRLSGGKAVAAAG